MPDVFGRGASIPIVTPRNSAIRGASDVARRVLLRDNGKRQVQMTAAPMRGGRASPGEGPMQTDVWYELAIRDLSGTERAILDLLRDAEETQGAPEDPTDDEEDAAA